MIKEIGSGKFRPVYYFFGDEDYRKKEAVKFILSHYISGKNNQLNLSKMSADKTELESIIGEIAAIPMLGDRRLIYVEDVQRLKPTQYKKLFGYLKSPPPETVIILSSPSVRTPQKKSAFFREVKKISELVQFNKLTDQKTRARIIRHLQSEGYTYDEEAVELLLSLTGGNFGGLVGELEKLSLSQETGSHIGLEEIKKLASSYEEFGIFELIDMISEKKYENALKAYNDLISRGSSSVGVVVLIGRQMINMLKALEGRKIAGHPFWVDKLRRQANLYGRERVVSAISSIAKTEKDIRTSLLKPNFLVENLIREISR